MSFCDSMNAASLTFSTEGGEVAVPQKGQLLAERGIRHHHSVHPPHGDLAALRDSGLVTGFSFLQSFQLTRRNGDDRVGPSDRIGARIVGGPGEKRFNRSVEAGRNQRT